MKTAGLVAALTLVAASAAAQTIRPLVSEHGREARGRFEVVNDSDRPLNVTLEPRGFSVNERGEMLDEPMPAAVQLKLSDMSFRLPPRGSRFVFYEAHATGGPAWFVVYANLTGFPAREFSGVNVQLELPHIVYLLPQGGWKEGDLRVVDTAVDRERGVVAVTIENRGSQFGRVAGVTVRGPREVDAPGFPLFPGGRRRIEVPWTAEGAPEAIAVDARSFSFEHRLTRGR